MGVDIKSIEESLKCEMKLIVESLSNEDVLKTRNVLERYFSFFEQLVDFQQFRTENVVKCGILVDFDNKVKEIETLEEAEVPIETPNLITETKGNVEKSDNEGTKPMYRFERKIKGGFLPEISAFVPESVIRNLNLENNCYLYAEEVEKEYDDTGQRHFKYELAKDSTDPFCPNRTQLNFCLIEKKDNMLVVNKSLETGEDIRINDAPYSVLIGNHDITTFKLKEGDLVDIAFPTNKPTEVRVLWVHHFNENDNEEEISRKISTTSNSHKKKKIISDTNTEINDLFPTLEGKNILIIGNEPHKTDYKKYIEDRGGIFLWADAKESLIRLKPMVRKSDVVVFLLKYSGHTGMEKIKAYCKEYDVPFLTTFNVGKSSIVRMVEELEATS